MSYVTDVKGLSLNVEFFHVSPVKKQIFLHPSYV